MVKLTPPDSSGFVQEIFKAPFAETAECKSRGGEGAVLVDNVEKVVDAVALA